MKPTAYDCTLGFDLKIDPNDQPFVIEFNGKDSGIKGLTALGLEKVDQTRYLAKECLAGIRPPSFITTFCPGGTVMDDGTELGPHYKMRLDESPSILRSNIHGLPQEYELQEKCRPLETIAGNKLLQKEFIPAESRSLYTVWDGQFDMLETFVEQLAGRKPESGSAYPYVVGKKAEGAHGDDVRIFRYDELPIIKTFFRRFSPGTALLEDFVPSKPIGESEDGCMRYLVDFVVYVDQEGQPKYEPVYQAGYWRISPGDENSDLDERYKANLTGKYPAAQREANPNDLYLARKTALKILGNLMERPEIFQVES